MELKITKWQAPEIIQFNFEELKAEISAKAGLYKNMIYTDETIKEAKRDKAALNKFIKALEDKRKEVKKQCLEPYQSFEKQIKELVSIINEPVMLISQQVADYEDREKEEKRKAIEELFDSIGFQPFVKLEMIFSEKWLNKTVSTKNIEEEMKEHLYQIGNDISAINSLPEFSFEALDYYKRTLNLSGAIAEGQRLADIQKRKLEREAELKAEAEKEVINKAEEESPSEIEKTINTDEKSVMSPKKWINFSALLDIDQAKELKAFCKLRDIEIKQI